MASGKILALGSTGTSGTCLLRELLHRKHTVIAYVRNPSKIPEDIASNQLLEIIKGEMDDTSALSAAIAKSSLIVSLLGLRGVRNHPPYAAWYLIILNLMREHGVKRILAPCAAAANQPGDSFHLVGFIMVLLARVVFPGLYTTARSIEQVFKGEGQGLEWIVYRLGRMLGSDDEESWKKDREDETYVGSVGDKEWRIFTRRGALARWLVDCVEGRQGKWIGKMPAVSNGSGGKKKTT